MPTLTSQQMPDAQYATFIVKAHVIARDKPVSFAGQQDVITARIATTGNAIKPRGKQGSKNGRRCCMRFLASKASTHSAYLNLDSMHR